MGEFTDVQKFEAMAEQLALEFGLDAVLILGLQETQDGLERTLISGSGLRMARVEMAREYIAEMEIRHSLLIQQSLSEDEDDQSA